MSHNDILHPFSHILLIPCQTIEDFQPFLNFFNLGAHVMKERNAISDEVYVENDECSKCHLTLKNYWNNNELKHKVYGTLLNVYKAVTKRNS